MVFSIVEYSPERTSYSLAGRVLFSAIRDAYILVAARNAVLTIFLGCVRRMAI
jgi:hypothetical protein